MRPPPLFNFDPFGWIVGWWRTRPRSKGYSTALIRAYLWQEHGVRFLPGVPAGTVALEFHARTGVALWSPDGGKMWFIDGPSAPKGLNEMVLAR